MNKTVLSLTLVALSLPASEAALRSDTSASSSRMRIKEEGSDRFHGSVGFDSSSFLYTNTSRGTQATTVTASIRGSTEGELLHTEGELSGFSFLTNRPQIGFESTELYTRTKSGLLGNLTLSAGRKLENWSKLDGTWRMMSLWSPRWTWDELHPTVIGMTGLFANYDTPRFKFVFFASPISIPERGTPVSEENGNLVSPNPFWKPLPSSLNVLGANTPIRYSLVMPAITEVLFRPNFALKARYQSDNGFFVAGNSGVLPVHMVQMAAEPFVNTSGSSGTLEVNIRPQFPMRNINTLEAGYESPDGRLDAWVSGSVERPFRFQNRDTWLNPIITPSTILSAGVQSRINQDLVIHSSVLTVKEEAFNRSSKLPDVNVDLPSRFPLKQGIQLGGRLRVSDRSEGNADWIHDLLDGHHFASLAFQHTIPNPGLILGVGMDLVLANDTRGWIGHYAGDDRIRGWLKYAF
jgi:hypothetical protein